EIAEEAVPKLTGEEQAEWLQRLEAEHENLRAALNWSLAEAESKASLRLCVALRHFWELRGYVSEGQEWFERALGKQEGQRNTEERARALNGVSTMARMQGDYAFARACSEESVTILREIRDRNSIAWSLANLGNMAYTQGDYTYARTCYDESLAL